MKYVSPAVLATVDTAEVLTEAFGNGGSGSKH
jgi:hypothetical protein